MVRRALVLGPMAPMRKPFQIANVSACYFQTVKEGGYAVHAGEQEPIVLHDFPQRLIHTVPGFRRRDLNGRKRNDFRACGFQNLDKFGGLIGRARDDDFFAEKRPRVKPAKFFAQVHYFSDQNQNR